MFGCVTNIWYVSFQNIGWYGRRYFKSCYYFECGAQLRTHELQLPQWCIWKGLPWALEESFKGKGGLRLSHQILESVIYSISSHWRPTRFKVLLRACAIMSGGYLFKGQPNRRRSAIVSVAHLQGLEKNLEHCMRTQAGIPVSVAPLVRNKPLIQQLTRSKDALGLMNTSSIRAAGSIPKRWSYYQQFAFHIIYCSWESPNPCYSHHFLGLSESTRFKTPKSDHPKPYPKLKTIPTYPNHQQPLFGVASPDSSSRSSMPPYRLNGRGCPLEPSCRWSWNRTVGCQAIGYDPIFVSLRFWGRIMHKICLMAVLHCSTLWIHGYVISCLYNVFLFW